MAEQQFIDNPILNSPYLEPTRHWALDEKGEPVGNYQKGRRRSKYLIPVPAARGRGRQRGLDLEVQEENHKSAELPYVNNIRLMMAEWRQRPPDKWGVTPATKELLLHWREKSEKRKRGEKDENDLSPELFFCQIEAAETLIWLNEVAPTDKKGKQLLEEIREANEEANPGLFRLAVKMATGSGKTMVMAMLIAYHAINKSRSPRSERFTNSFLIITPGITIRDRLRVLLPADSENYYKNRGIVPPDMWRDMEKARVVIQNYHAFSRRETRNLSPTARRILRGNGPDIITKETDDDMLARTCRDLLCDKSAIVINDEAHHCYQHADRDEEAKPTPPPPPKMAMKQRK